MQWKADSCQGVLFIGGGTPQLDALDGWKIISGGVGPENYQRPNISPIGQSHAAGTLDGFQVAFNSQFGRVDLVVSPAENNERFDVAQQFQDFREPLNMLTRLMLDLVKHMTLMRVALVVEFSRHLENIAQAPGILSQATGIDFISGSTDLIYQYNVRKRYINTPDYEMNRIRTWSTGVKQLFMGRVDVSNPIQMAAATPMITIPTVNLKLDLNSATATNITSVSTGLIEEHVGQVYEVTHELQGF